MYMLHVHRLFIAGKSGCSLPLAVDINFQTFTQHRFLVQDGTRMVQVYNDHEIMRLIVQRCSKKCQFKHLTSHTASVLIFSMQPLLFAGFFTEPFQHHPTMQNNYTKNRRMRKESIQLPIICLTGNSLGIQWYTLIVHPHMFVAESLLPKETL